MRAAFVVTLFLIPAIFPAVAHADGLERASACGRADYPSESAYNAAAVANATLWQSFRDQGGFTGVTALDEGANEIEVVASDDQGNQVNLTIFVTRGE